VVIAVIGILSTIVLVSTGGAREDAQEAAVLSMLRSTQTTIIRCLNKGKVLYCNGAASGSSAVQDCGGNNYGGASPAYVGGASNPRTTRFATNAPICGEKDLINGTGGDLSFGTWPDIMEYGYVYGPRAGSDNTSGRFSFYAYDNAEVNHTQPHTVICCTQDGCTMEEHPSDIALANFDANGWSYDSFCRDRSGHGANED
jgi:type II secretory pathway pseudopilin PulG